MTDRETSPTRVREHVRLSRYAANVTDQWTGADITRRRIDAGLSKRQLADALGVSVATISRWEQADRPNIDPKNVERLNATLPEPAAQSYPDGIWDGPEIKRRRQLLGLSQDQLAKRVGAGKRTLQDWEWGNTTPPLRHLEALHAILRLPEDAPSVVEGVALADADFADVVLRLVEIHNEARRRLGQPPLLQVGDITLPSDLPEHYRTEGPDINTADRVENSATHKDSTHPQ